MQKNIVGLVAEDRIELPLSSLRNKLQKRKLAAARDLADSLGGVGSSFSDGRVYARVEAKDRNLARGMKEAISEFSDEYPEYGEILKDKVAKKRKLREEHLYFGMNGESRLCGSDYLGVLKNLGISEHQAHIMYPALMETSRKLHYARDRAERSIIVGKYDL